MGTSSMPKPLTRPAEPVSINIVTVADLISRSFVKRIGLYDLLGRPLCAGMRCNIEVNHLASIMSQDHETVKHAECRSRRKRLAASNGRFDATG